MPSRCQGQASSGLLRAAVGSLAEFGSDSDSKTSVALLFSRRLEREFGEFGERLEETSSGDHRSFGDFPQVANRVEQTKVVRLQAFARMGAVGVAGAADHYVYVQQESSMHAMLALASLGLIGVVLLDAFEAMVLPRR